MEVKPTMGSDGKYSYQETTVNKPQVTVEDVNAAVAEAGDVPVLTEKQKKRREQQEKQFWNGMVTRKEASEQMNMVATDLHNKLSLMFIQVRTMTKVLIEKGIITEEELNELSKSVVTEIYGEAPVSEATADQTTTDTPTEQPTVDEAGEQQ